jgi:hypothetical protein
MAMNKDYDFLKTPSGRKWINMAARKLRDEIDKQILKAMVEDMAMKKKKGKKGSKKEC